MQHLHTNKKYGGVFMSEEKKEKEKSLQRQADPGFCRAVYRGLCGP